MATHKDSPWRKLEDYQEALAIRNANERHDLHWSDDSIQFLLDIIAEKDAEIDKLNNRIEGLEKVLYG